jgi:hypothetical protein
MSEPAGATVLVSRSDTPQHATATVTSPIETTAQHRCCRCTLLQSAMTQFSPQLSAHSSITMITATVNATDCVTAAAALLQVCAV